jgi:hypothetical protein
MTQTALYFVLLPMLVAFLALISVNTTLRQKISLCFQKRMLSRFYLGMLRNGLID